MRTLVATLAIALLIASPLRAQFLGFVSSRVARAQGVSCTAGAIDLSLLTGCNIPLFIGGVLP
jgi:hypothetical protein